MIRPVLVRQPMLSPTWLRTIRFPFFWSKNNLGFCCVFVLSDFLINCVPIPVIHDTVHKISKKFWQLFKIQRFGVPMRIRKFLTSTVFAFLKRRMDSLSVFLWSQLLIGKLYFFLKKKLFRLTRSNNKCLIRTSPSNGSATLTTPFMHCTASLGQTSHLFVR